MRTITRLFCFGSQQLLGSFSRTILSIKYIDAELRTYIQAQPMKNTIYLIQYSMLEHLLISSIYLVESDALFFATIKVKVDLH